MEENVPPVGRDEWKPPAGAVGSAPSPGAAPQSWAPPSGVDPNNPTSLADILPDVASGPTVIDTSSGKSDGLNKCPKCGATDISTQPGTGMLLCNFCRHIFEYGQREGAADASKLVGEIFGSGAANITQAENTQITMKCQGCGAEVVVDIDHSMTSRCHWCRQVLSLENQIPNGAVPDLVLPFLLSKQQAQEKIQEFVKKRTFFAHPKFKQEFTTENIIGVYLPYMVVDANVQSDLRGVAGQIARSYYVGSDKNKRQVYDINIYEIGRSYKLLIDDLTVEASSEKRTINSKNNTNNVINTILPFDIENSIPYSGNYLKGFNSERRDTNIDELRELVGLQIGDVSRFQANGTATAYNAGIEWKQENNEIQGIQWKAAYLPVWLYSYYEIKKNGERFLHYVAVNARTGETMGSVPLDTPRLLLVSGIVEAGALIITALAMALMMFA